MRFVKTDEIRNGMRIGRPIYNKKGVLLYDRDSKLTEASISSIKNFGLIGIYVLDPAEPLPPMTDEDREFERFQTVNVFALEAEIKEILMSKHVKKLELICNEIISSYGHLHGKVNFIQNIRSHEDFVYKHSLNVAILAAMMSNKMNLPVPERLEIMYASLLHDIGKLTIPQSVLQQTSPLSLERLYENAEQLGYPIIDNLFPSNPGVKRICMQTNAVLMDLKYARTSERPKAVTGTRILTVADTFDTLTAMSVLNDEEPKSYIMALKYLYDHPEAFHPRAVETLVESVAILPEGTSVELSNGNRALVVTKNPNNVLKPVVLDFSTNELMDLTNEKLYGDIYIVDASKTMDDRYVMDKSLMINETNGN